MSSTKLIELLPSKGLDSGIAPSADPTAGLIWKDSKNIIYREAGIEHSLGRQKLFTVTGRPAQAMAQAFNAPTKSLYYENLGFIYHWPGAGAPVIIGALESNGDYWLEPWGTWLLLTDNIKQPKIWQGGAFIPIGVGQFSTAKIIKKIAQFAVAYNTDVLPNGFFWTDVSDPTQWTPTLTGAARNLEIRDLDSEIVAVADLGGSHAVYSRDNMLLVQYVGVNAGWLGTPQQGINGIGALSKRAIIAQGRYNYGMSRAGVFITDGNNFTYVDRPQVDKWIQEDIDFSLAAQISGYWNDRLGLAVWIVPLLTTSSYYTPATPRIALALDPKTSRVTTEATARDPARRSFSFLDGSPLLGMSREVFENPIASLEDGIYLEGVTNTLTSGFTINSQLFDAGDQSVYKLWDYAIFSGKRLSGNEVRFGFTDEPTLESIQWNAWQPLTYHCPFNMRESVFFSVQLRGAEELILAGIHVFGEKGGQVN